MCQNRQLYQVDLLNPALDKVTEQEYWAQRRGQEKLDQRNEEIREAGLKPRTTKFETQKGFLRDAIKATAAKSNSLEEFQSFLLSDYGISLRDKRGRFSYTHPDREKAITGRALGSAYERDYILEQILQNQKLQEVEQPQTAPTLSDTEKSVTSKKEKSPKRKIPAFTTTKVRLIIDLETCIKAQKSNAYARKIKVINLQQMAQTLAYVQEHGYASVEELEQELSARKEKTSVSRKELKATESQLADVNKQIRLTGQYLGNKAIYADYRKTGKSKKFYEEHRAELALYESARDTLRELSGGQKLPSLKALKAERDDLVLTKNGQYESYQTARMEEKELQTICSNVHQMLDLNQTQTLEKERGTEIS
jgi:ribosomal protein S12